MAKPLVTIVVPIYKVEDYIENSVKSVISQTYENIELILVDDGSPDNSVSVAERVLKEHSYPYKLIRQENRGLGEARNTGAVNSAGEWILFLDSDDMLAANAVEDLVGAARSDCDLIFSGYNLISSQSDALDKTDRGGCEYLSADRIQNGFLRRNYVILAAGTLFKSDLLKSGEMRFEKIPWSEDQHFIWRFISRISGAVFLDEPLYQYLKRPGSIMTSSNIENIIKSYPAICELPEFYKDNPTVKRFMVARWVLGTLSSCAKFTDYKNWMTVYKKTDGKRHLKTLLCFPSVLTKARAFVCLAFPKIYYRYFSKRA